MEHHANQVILSGTLAGEPEFSHENHGKRFLRFYMDVPRLSGTVDTLPVVTPLELFQDADPKPGDGICVTGQIRSHNLRREGRRRLLIFVFAATLRRETGEAVNHVMLEGAICRQPTYRRTPLNREICDIMLAVPRAFHRADYLPCILWGKTAQEASRCLTGDIIQICGRLQSRVYTKLMESGAQQRTAYEISALTASFPEERLVEDFVYR